MRKFCKTKLFSLLVFTIIILVNINEANVDLDANIHLDDNSNATTLKKGVEGCFRADPGGNGYTYKWTKPSSSTSRKFYKSNNKGPIDFKCEVKKDGETDIETKTFTWAEVIADQFTVTGADKIDCDNCDIYYKDSDKENGVLLLIVLNIKSIGMLIVKAEQM